MPAAVGGGVIIDQGVGSSGEQFLLEIFEGLLVTFFGRPTAWVLDYSNLWPWSLPSGRGTLRHATSRSLRIPADAIERGDHIGVKLRESHERQNHRSRGRMG